MSRAVVLSGGGPVGIAWQTGIAASLAAAGVDLAAADLIVGTSAGSAVGAQLALGRDMAAQLTRYRQATARRAEADAEPPAGRPGGSGGRGVVGVGRLMQTMAAVADLSPEERRRQIGRFALEADTGPEDRFVDTFAYLAGEPWPTRYVCTAVDAESGEFVVWDADAGVELHRAVASSCAVPGVYPPITIGGRRYIDGGMRSATNADLAAGHDRVLIVSLMARPRPPADAADGAPADDAAAVRLRRYRRAMEAEYTALRESGAAVATLGPDEAFAAAIGMNLMDSSRVATAAEIGFAQGQREAARWRSFWVDGRQSAAG